MPAKKLLAITLTSLSIAAVAAPTAKTAPKTKKQTSAAKAQRAQKADGSNSTPAEIKEQIALLKARLAKMDNNAGEPKAHFNWQKYVSVTGLVNMDASYYSKPYFGAGNRETTSSSFLDLGTANLAASAHFGHWVSGRVSLLSQNGQSPAVRNADPYLDANHHVKVDQAFIPVANFAQTPYFVRVGQQYAPFGRYQRYPLTNTLTQSLSQTDAPIAQLGFVTDAGFYGSAYALSGEHKYGDSNSTNIKNGGFNIGIQRLVKQMSFDIGMSYIANMADVDSIRSLIETQGGYRNRVPGVGGYLNVYAGPFEFGAQVISATQRFSSLQYAYQESSGNLVGAKPSAGDVNAEYSFKTAGHNSQAQVSFQWTSQAHNSATGVNATDPTVLPKKRISVSYGVNLMKHLATSVQLYRDYDYKANHGGTNNHDNVAMLRLSLMM